MGNETFLRRNKGRRTHVCVVTTTLYDTECGQAAECVHVDAYLSSRKQLFRMPRIRRLAARRRQDSQENSSGLDMLMDVIK